MFNNVLHMNDESKVDRGLIANILKYGQEAKLKFWNMRMSMEVIEWLHRTRGYVSAKEITWNDVPKSSGTKLETLENYADNCK